MSDWVKVDEGVYAEEATPDPVRMLDAAGIQRLTEELTTNLEMYQDEIDMLTVKVTEIQNEVAELETLLQ